MNNSCRYSPQSSTTWVISEICYYIVLPILNSHLFCIATLSFRLQVPMLNKALYTNMSVVTTAFSETDKFDGTN